LHNRSPDATAADSDPTLDSARNYSPGERDYKVGIIVTRIHQMRPEFGYFVPHPAETGGQIFLRNENSMIPRNSNAQVCSPHLYMTSVREPILGDVRKSSSSMQNGWSALQRPGAWYQFLQVLPWWFPLHALSLREGFAIQPARAVWS
jgi:hypothetical protein